MQKWRLAIFSNMCFSKDLLIFSIILLFDSATSALHAIKFVAKYTLCQRTSSNCWNCPPL